jgi:DNA repair exonuclease SbcCD ATPase subunit
MSSTANGLARSEKDPLLSLAQRLPEAQDREWYGALVSYIHSLQPTDELVKIAELFGFLTLMANKLPDAIADEQNKLRNYLSEAYEKLQQEIKTNASYHQKLNERLSQLPAEIAAGVKPDAIAKAMSESFRQQILKTGLQEAQTVLTSATSDLKTTTKALDAAIEPITKRYDNLALTVEKQATRLDSVGSQLARTADTIQSKNEQLMAEVRSWHGIWVVTASVAILLVGFFCGTTWEQRNVGDLVVSLQNQIAQLQQALKTPAAPSPAEPAGKHLKKK